MATKVCSKCKKRKSVNNFYRDRTSKDKLYSCCKSCHLKVCKKYLKSPKAREYQKQYRKNNKEKIKENRKKYVDTHRISNKKYRMKNKNNKKYQDARWAARLKHHFDLTIKEWQQMYDEQEGYCPICGKHQSELSKKLCVHHLVIDGEIIIIALLCIKCNLGIANLKHNVELLEKAIKFIKEKHPNN